MITWRAMHVVNVLLRAVDWFSWLPSSREKWHVRTRQSVWWKICKLSSSNERMVWIDCSFKLLHCTARIGLALEHKQRSIKLNYDQSFFRYLTRCEKASQKSGRQKVVQNTICVFSLHDGYSGMYMLICIAWLCFSMSSSKSASHVVVGWKNKGEEAFENELVEAILLKKSIFKGSAQIGTVVSMQYKNELWMGKILSVHGKCTAISHDRKNSIQKRLLSGSDPLKQRLLKAR